MLYEGCNQPISNTINGGIKEDFSPPFYEEEKGDVQKEGHIILLDED